MSNGLPRPEDVEGIETRNLLCILYRAVYALVTNDLPHLQDTVGHTRRDILRMRLDMWWMRKLLLGLLLPLVAAVIGGVVKMFL